MASTRGKNGIVKRKELDDSEPNPKNPKKSKVSISEPKKKGSTKTVAKKLNTAKNKQDNAKLLKEMVEKLKGKKESVEKEKEFIYNELNVAEDKIPTPPLVSTQSTFKPKSQPVEQDMCEQFIQMLTSKGYNVTAPPGSNSNPISVTTVPSIAIPKVPITQPSVAIPKVPITQPLGKLPKQTPVTPVAPDPRIAANASKKRFINSGQDAIHPGIPAIHRRYINAAKFSGSAQKFTKWIIKGLFPDPLIRGSISAMGTKSNTGIDEYFPNFPNVRRSIKRLLDDTFGGDYPISVINGWINGSAGDARKNNVNRLDVDDEENAGDADAEDADDFDADREESEPTEYYD